MCTEAENASKTTDDKSTSTNSLRRKREVGDVQSKRRNTTVNNDPYSYNPYRDVATDFWRKLQAMYDKVAELRMEKCLKTKSIPICVRESLEPMSRWIRQVFGADAFPDTSGMTAQNGTDDYLDQPCREDDGIICLGPTSFGICRRGVIESQPVAPGTLCFCPEPVPAGAACTQGTIDVV